MRVSRSIGAHTRIAVLTACLAGGVTGCGTTYEIPRAADPDLTEARRMFAEERDPATAGSGARPSASLAAAQYRRVVSRVEPVAERFCRTETADRPGFECDVEILVDTSSAHRNAYQIYADGRPVVVVTLPLVADARNEDELAFVLGHEFGHHIGRHIEKQQQQAAAGAIIAGTLVAYGQASSSYNSPYRNTYQDQRTLQQGVAAGAALGRAAYSQTYELESDVIGAYIAEAAGYDAARGARFFARPEPARRADGALSFWGTHPPDEKRLATVLATVSRMDEAGAPTWKEATLP